MNITQEQQDKIIKELNKHPEYVKGVWTDCHQTVSVVSERMDFNSYIQIQHYVAQQLGINMEELSGVIVTSLSEINTDGGEYIER